MNKYLVIVIGVILLCGGAFYKGRMMGIETTETKWKLVVAKADAKIAELQAQGAQTTVQVVTKYVDKVKIVKEKGDVIIQKVPVYITQADNSRCVIPAGFVLLHNAAAANKVP